MILNAATELKKIKPCGHEKSRVENVNFNARRIGSEIEKNSATRYVVLIFENDTFGRFCNSMTKIKTKTWLQRFGEFS